jgi:oxygen-independent coproporphyrinogen-3 oxidase
MELDVLNDRAQTEVGSYFVANYPPFSAWKADHLPAVEAVLNSKPDAPAPPLGLYLHIPFCRKRCRFCYFRVYTDKNSDEVETYLAALSRELALYAERERFANRPLDFVYFGGGTPSFLSNTQLEGLVARIAEHWTWDQAREVTFECEPGTLKESKLATIRDMGVTRLSLGVEHFDDQVLELNGRAHRSPEIFRAYEWARTAGFPQLNIDLIAGMVGDDETKWKKTVDQALALAPDSVTIYQMELPHNTVIAREMKTGAEEHPVADWPAKRAWVAHAFQVFQQAGYEISSAYTLVKPGPHSGFVYRDALWHGGDMLGTGVASFSHVGGLHFQNVDGWDEYVNRLQAGELPLGRALPISADQALIREFALQTKLGRVDLNYFRTKFGIEPRHRFADAFAYLQQHQYATLDGDTLQLSSAGLLRVDALLPLFFEPQYRGVRYT